MTHGAYGVVRHRMAHASWEFVMSHGPWVMEKKSLNGVSINGALSSMQINTHHY